MPGCKEVRYAEVNFNVEFPSEEGDQRLARGCKAPKGPFFFATNGFQPARDAGMLTATATTMPPPAPSAAFHTTRWSRVVLAREPSHEGQEALRLLCATYYAPVIAFLRREGRTEDAARELAHDFFATVLAGSSLARAEPSRGRFRSYLLGAVKHFLSHQRETALRMCRGGGLQPLSMDADDAPVVADASQLSPDAAFDREWAHTVLRQAMEALQHEQEAGGKGMTFERLRPWLSGEAAHGDQAALADSLDMNVNTLKATTHRLRQRFRALVRAEIATTLEDATAVEDEMQVLFTALRNR